MARPKRNADCHPDQPHKGKGLCKNCYAVAYRRENVERATAWARNNPERYKANLRRANLRRNYGITPEEFDDLVLVDQHNECGICGHPFTDEPGYKPKQDHNHKNGMNRGALCTRCNLMIGYALEKPKILMDAALYLAAWRAIHASY